jgi:hypothetical protein
MTNHPKEAGEVMARTLSKASHKTSLDYLPPAWQERYRSRATAILDIIAPMYLEQAARVVLGHAKAIRQQEANAATWGGPDPRGEHYRTNALAYAVSLENIAAAICKGE